MAEKTKKELEVEIEELQNRVASLKTSNDALTETNTSLIGDNELLKNENLELSNDKGVLVEEIERLKNTIISLEEELETASTQVPQQPATEQKGAVQRPGIYLKDDILFIKGFGHVQKADGPLSQTQLKALRDSFDEKNWSDEQIAKKFLVEIEG